MPYRVKEYFCGDFLELEIFPVSRKEVKQTRAAKRKESEPKQKNLNCKNSKKYLRRLVHNNFTDEDVVIHLTYTNKTLPKSEEEAKNDVGNYIRRVNYRMKKRGLPNVKYIAILEYEDAEGKKNIRLHHHVLISGDIDRDELEDIWKKGRANADRLKADENGYEDLVNYITKDPKGKKRWTSSRNLKKPVPNVSDYKYTNKRVREIANAPEDRTLFEKFYPEHILNRCQVSVNDYTAGIHLFVKLRRIKT